MEIKDKKSVLKTLGYNCSIVLELGCGNRKRNKNSIGIDILDLPDVDIVGDVFDVFKKIPNNSIDSIESYHFVEHIHPIDTFLSEVERILKPDGVLKTVVPHFSNPYFYSDPTHRNPFGLYTFSYFADSKIFRRRVPQYMNKFNFVLVSVDLRFKSFPPNYVRHTFKLILGSVFNSCRFMREFYEENLCYIFPCYEIQYVVKKK